MTSDQVLAYLLANYPKETVPEDTQAFWLAELADVDSDLLMLAARYHVNRGNGWFPAVSHMRHALLQVEEDYPSAFEAWGEVVRVLTSSVHKRVRCEEGEQLYVKAGKAITDYWAGILEYDSHVRSCENCYDESANPQFENKIAERIARDLNITKIIPEREVSDRAQFIRAYEQALENKRAKVNLRLLEG